MTFQILVVVSNLLNLIIYILLSHYFSKINKAVSKLNAGL